MKTPRSILSFCLLSSALCPLSSVLCSGAAPDRFERTKAHVETLLSHRLKPDTLPAKPVMTDEQILAFCVTRIRIGGQVMRGERAHLLINSATYKEGDLIPVRANTETVYYVKIVRISVGEVVFGYNDVFVTLPLKT